MIESAGYTAAAPAPPSPEGPTPDPERRALARRLAVCAPLAVAVIVLSMVPAAQFPGWQWVSLLLAAPVAAWGAWPLYRAAWYGLGHGAATMDTLVSVGVGASFCWSVYALLFGGAGATGMKMSFAFAFGQAGGDTLYLEAAAAAVARIRRLGIRPLLVTGDNEHAARSVADGLGIPGADVLAGVKPEGKVEAVGTCRPAGPRSPWWATGSTTPPRWLRPTSAWPSGPAPTRPSAPPT